MILFAYRARKSPLSGRLKRKKERTGTHRAVSSITQATFLSNTSQNSEVIDDAIKFNILAPQLCGITELIIII